MTTEQECCDGTDGRADKDSERREEEARADSDGLGEGCATAQCQHCRRDDADRAENVGQHKEERAERQIDLEPSREDGHDIEPARDGCVLLNRAICEALR